RRLEKSRQRAKAEPKLSAEVDALARLAAMLDRGEPAHSFDRSSLELSLAKELSLLTAKPILYVANVDEAGSLASNRRLDAVAAFAASHGAECIALCAKLEAELAGLPEAEAAAFAKELGMEASGLDRLIVAAYRLLDLMTFLTAGEKETRAWTIER